MWGDRMKTTIPGAIPLGGIVLNRSFRTASFPAQSNVPDREHCF